MTDSEGVPAFVRRYAKTWVHALATAAMTAFGTLTVVDNRFAALAIAAYVLPPVALYLRGRDGSRTSGRDGPATAAGERADSEGGDRAGGDAAEPRERAAWTAATVPTTATLHDAAVGASGAYAVGEGGVVLADDGDGWTVALPDGPSADGASLRAADAAGDAVWVAGDGGALGRLAGATGRHTDHSAPAGDTTNLVAVAATETGDGETVLVADGGGRVRRGVFRAGELAWDDPSTPGSGASVAGLTLAGEAGYLCDTAGAVFETTDGGRSFVRVGIEGVEGTPSDVGGAGVVATDAGVCYRHDGGGWTPDRLGEAALTGVETGGDRWLAAAADGAVFERDGGGWTRTVTPASGLAGIAAGGERALAVGESGTVVERGSTVTPPRS
ncbi:hypothetical protein [Haloarcula litorea]|uniref:hypothetical protein n=1 Tax=Haloarcula litorea TaxID=3032579 RepID=UPI0023E7860A|nr:hypothetical protein [Halomicroarcula sp. GDY20]